MESIKHIFNFLTDGTIYKVDKKITYKFNYNIDKPFEEYTLDNTQLVDTVDDIYIYFNINNNTVYRWSDINIESQEKSEKIIWYEWIKIDDSFQFKVIIDDEMLYTTLNNLYDCYKNNKGKFV